MLSLGDPGELPSLGEAEEAGDDEGAVLPEDVTLELGVPELGDAEPPPDGIGLMLGEPEALGDADPLADGEPLGDPDPLGDGVPLAELEGDGLGSGEGPVSEKGENLPTNP